MESANNIIDKIVALTFTRHANLSDEEFLKAIGSKDKDEEEAVIKGRFAIISACTKELLKANDKIKLINAQLKLYMEKKNGRSKKSGN